MFERAYFLLAFAAAIGSAVVAGIFYAFSSFVMPALGRLPPPQGITAMQSINLTVVNASFFVAFFGTALVCVVLAIVSGFRLGDTGARLILLASLIYLLGCIGVTIFANVPLNRALAAVTADAAQAGTLWARYLVDWTAWNTVRTVAPVVSAMLFITALRT